MAFEGPFAVTVSGNQRYDQHGNRLKGPLNRSTRRYVKTIEAALIVVYLDYTENLYTLNYRVTKIHL